MTQTNSLHPLWVLVNKRGDRLKDLSDGVCFPVFHYPIQALRFADGMRINPGVYDIVRLE